MSIFKKVSIMLIASAVSLSLLTTTFASEEETYFIFEENLIEKEITAQPNPVETTKLKLIVTTLEVIFLTYENVETILEKNPPPEILDFIPEELNPEEEEDIKRLSYLLTCEVYPEDILGKQGVCYTALNRLTYGLWGDTLEEVLTYPYQFARYSARSVIESDEEIAKSVYIEWKESNYSYVGRDVVCDGVPFFFDNSDGDRYNSFRQGSIKINE